MEGTRYYRAVHTLPFCIDDSYVPGKGVVAEERRDTEEEHAIMDGMPVLHRRHPCMHQAEGCYSNGAPTKNGGPSGMRMLLSGCGISPAWYRRYTCLRKGRVLEWRGAGEKRGARCLEGACYHEGIGGIPVLY